MEVFSVEAEGAGDASRANRARQIKFNTQENLTDEALARIGSWHGKYGHLVFLPEIPEPENLVDLPKLKNFDQHKSPSQRLRSVLFILWQQRGEKDEFDLWYINYMNSLIEKVKEKLA